MSNPNRSDQWNGLSQWPIIALAWCFHGGLLFVSVFSRLPPEKLDLLNQIAVALGLVSLLVFEACLLVFAAALLERFRPGQKLAIAFDLIKSAVLCVALSALILSTAKFLSAGVHLKISDLWFAYTSANQILQEAQVAEVLAISAVPLLSTLTFIASFLGFRRARFASKQSTPKRYVALLLSAAFVFTIAYGQSGILPTIVKGFVPEGNWVMVRRSHTGLLATGKSLSISEAQGTAINAYDPGQLKQPFNVVLIMLESLPWKRTWLNEESREGLTPNLKKLSEESVVFDRAYAASTHSCYAQLAILSSLHPRKYDHRDYYLDIQYPRALIWDALKAAGYSTGLFSCQNERWGNMHRFLKTPGLDVFRHSLDWPDEPHKGRGKQSKVYEPTPIAKWQNWRRRRVEGNYFAYLNFQSNHFPYEIPEDAERTFEPSEIDFAASYLNYPVEEIPVMLNRFDNAQNYADHYVGEVIDFLKAQGDWDSTVLIVASDHGEAFYEHGYPTHGTTLHEEQIRSLLMIRVPGIDARRSSEPVSMLDVAPTTLELLGMQAHGNMQGRGDILDLDYDGSERPIFFTIQGITLEDGVLMGDLKLIVNLDRESKQLFDLRSDPDELIDLHNSDAAGLLQMEQVLGSFLNRQLRYYSSKEWERGFYPPRLP